MYGVWILGDQLNIRHPALQALEDRLGSARARHSCRVLLIESSSVLNRQAFHRQKLVLVWSAMRHFAIELERCGWQVERIETSSFSTALEHWTSRHGLVELHLMEPADRPFRAKIHATVQQLASKNPLQVHWHPSNAFLWSRDAFACWAQRYRQPRMEFFYRESRKRFNVLMEGDQPLGGQWNYDHDNRKAPPRDLQPPQPLSFEPDSITEAVINRVEALDRQRTASGLVPLPGVSRPFRWGVNRDQALQVLEHFIQTRLDGFGPYQDAMVRGQSTLWHALLSPYLNLGLLHPWEVIRRLESAGLERGTPPASLEGVLRQILGWREYTHGLYHWLGADYPKLNHFNAHSPLPSWLEQLSPCGMSCLDTVLGEIHSSGYAHHIQRLMVLANYGLLAGLDPQAFTAWFHRMFIDGFDWVMQTNVLGMGLFADGGRLASKPYAASGSYINRMSNYCKACRYDPKQRTGEQACPFNVLYWDFLARHANRLRGNPRMALMIRQLDRMPSEELQAIRARAASHLERPVPNG